MIIMPYQSGKDYDEGLTRLVQNIKKATTENNDDFLILCVGDTGVGKSMLMLHAYELYAGKKATMQSIGLNMEKFANALNFSSQQEKGFRFLGYDEASVLKRDSLTKINKDLIKLYLAIRGVNIFHWWNNPSLEMIDKAFVQEKIRGVIIVQGKWIDRPRLYYYISKSNLLKIIEKYKTLNMGVISKREVRKKYSSWRGWFRDYKGFLKKDYLKEKGSRMDDSITDFYNKYGEQSNYFTKPSAARKLGIHTDTIRNYEKELKERGDFIQNVHYTVNERGYTKYTSAGIEKLKEMCHEKHKNFNLNRTGEHDEGIVSND